VLMFDTAGVRAADPVPKVRTLDDRATEVDVAASHSLAPVTVKRVIALVPLSRCA
jgi:hypothetical protein